MDLRLGATLTVLDPADPSKCFDAVPEALSGVLPASLEAGEEVIIPLRSGVGFNKCELTWRLDSRCRYRILVNQGGGQFAPVKELETGGGVQKPRFDKVYKASDLKIQLLEGHGTLTAFECQAL